MTIRPQVDEWVRRDDDKEVVIITSRERHPNGLINFQYVLPPNAKGKTGSLAAEEFYRSYYNRDEKKPSAIPDRPVSTGTKEEWRAYALHLESILPATVRGLAAEDDIPF